MQNVNILFKSFDSFVNVNKFHKTLIKTICGERIIDLLLHFPYDVQFRTCSLEKALAHNNFERQIMFNDIINVIDYDFSKNVFKIICNGKYGNITIIYFNGNSSYIKRKYKISSRLLVSGKVQKQYDGTLMIIHPDIITSNIDLYTDSCEPVYPLSGKLTNRVMTMAIRQCLTLVPKIKEWIPNEIIEKNGFSSFRQALYNIHYPRSSNDISINSSSVRRLAFDEMLANRMCMKKIRNTLQLTDGVQFYRSIELEKKANIPFELTDDQNKTLSEILQDLSSPIPMNRLVQGDVGSGKTVVAFLASLPVINAGYQVVFIAPTETLASQHFATLGTYAKNIGIDIDIILAKNRKYRAKQINDLKCGKTQLVIGTHALLEDKIEFNKLGLAIIDEQQRFGVMQRLKLIEKGDVMNALYLSATPIPRTLMLSLYGDLDISIISSKPKLRKPINTTVVGKNKLNNVIDRIINYHGQVYWICPYIEKSENKKIMDVQTRFYYLKERIGSVELLHGQMKPEEKESVMNNFRNGVFKVLVSTTVIEVGIDVPNANIIIIENAESFGLSQLHQLRGRVGRGSEQGYCVLVYDTPISKNGVERLQLMKNSNDGFELSEADMQIRGHGDLLGTKQSGFKTFRIFDFKAHLDLFDESNKLINDLEIDDTLLKIFNRIDNIKLM